MSKANSAKKTPDNQSVFQTKCEMVEQVYRLINNINNVLQVSQAFDKCGIPVYVLNYALLSYYTLSTF